MKPTIEKLKKIFTLEAERGYDNKAVHGGLEAMLDNWEAEARQDELPEELIQAVRARLRDYNRLSPDSRRDALKGLWNRIRREVGKDITPEMEKKPAPPPEMLQAAAASGEDHLPPADSAPEQTDPIMEMETAKPNRKMQFQTRNIWTSVYTTMDSLVRIFMRSQINFMLMIMRMIINEINM